MLLIEGAGGAIVSGPFKDKHKTHNLLVQRFTRGNHWVDVFTRNDTLHNNGSCTVVFQELLHHTRQILQICASHGFSTHGFGKLDKVWVVHSSVRVSVLVEQVLPLLDQSLELVVEEEDLDSVAVMENEASPSMSTTTFSGAPTLAPMAAGRPKPIV